MVLIIIRSWLWWWWASPVFPVLSLAMITSFLIIVEMNEMIYIKVTSDRLCLCSAYPSLRYQSRHGSQHSPSLAEIQRIQQNRNTNTVPSTNFATSIINWTLNLCACCIVRLICDNLQPIALQTSKNLGKLWDHCVPPKNLDITKNISIMEMFPV